MDERRPRWIYGAGHEPDPRFSLANERTFLAWVRTALAILAGAVALYSLGVPDPRWVRVTVVVALVLAGGLITLLAFVRWARVERAIRTATPLPAFTLGLGATVTVVLVAVLLAVALALGPG
ncbi:DUF202 domain-containing protein [Nocardioides sp. KIGAM211]|uniref:DUF202 domain-containing protein n=1 Tax=Nocardioides luti TaxID=2761101 RepID=A0A7X0V9Q1_9ACTN|nr:DUF202 domain-containing protein [Nocardioides luti]MBB6626924.1 DUF202 domain-containing protein [Nocardioides luti]